MNRISKTAGEHGTKTLLSLSSLQALLNDSSYKPVDMVNGPPNAHSRLRLFGSKEKDVRVTLFRDHHAWCPYCEKTLLWLEEKKIPYHVSKITMRCYGDPKEFPRRKESWYLDMVPSGMLPVLILDDQIISESDVILQALEDKFGELNGQSFTSNKVLRFRRLERKLFSAWCQWLCYPSRSKSEEAYSKQSFIDVASEVDEALSETNGSFFLAEGFGPADIVFLPYIERMSASLFYYKGYDLRREFEHIHAWFQGWEQRDTYRGFVSDFSTHVHDLPPQMGGCYTNNSKQSRVNAKIVDCGPFAVNEENERGRKGEQISDPLASEVSVRSFPEPQDSKETACYRVLRHWDTLADINPFGKEAFAVGMRAVLTYLLTGNLVKFSDTDRKSSADGEAQRDSSATDQSQKPKKEKKIKLSEVENIVLALIYVRDRISVPRDMPIWSGRRLREACDKVCKHNYAFDYHTAGSDGAGHLVLSGADVDARRYGKYDLKNSAMLRTRFDQCPVPFIGDPSTLLPPKHLRR